MNQFLHKHTHPPLKFGQIARKVMQELGCFTTLHACAAMASSCAWLQVAHIKDFENRHDGGQNKSRNG